VGRRRYVLLCWSPALSLVSRSLSENSLDKLFKEYCALINVTPARTSGSDVYQKLPIVESSQKGRRVVL
jgi:hypothetical protein